MNLSLIVLDTLVLSAMTAGTERLFLETNVTQLAGCQAFDVKNIEIL